MTRGILGSPVRMMKWHKGQTDVSVSRDVVLKVIVTLTHAIEGVGPLFANGRSLTLQSALCFVDLPIQ